MRVLVCGGRMFDNHVWVARELEQLRPSIVIHGDATGADFCAKTWASRSGVAVSAFPAEWRAYGKSAGPRRNQQMLDEGKPDIVLAFPGGRGTADMVRRARAAGLRVRELTW